MAVILVIFLIMSSITLFYFDLYILIASLEFVVVWARGEQKIICVIVSHIVPSSQ